MSTELYSTGASTENDASLQGSMVGGSKPLHRFIRGQPKIVGIIVLILGVSFFTISIAMNIHTEFHNIFSAIPTGFMLGSLFIICGILFILTEHNPTKRTVTLSLAFSVVTTLAGAWSALYIIIDLRPNSYYRHDDYDEDNSTDKEENYWNLKIELMEFIVEAIFTFYYLVGIIVFIVMSSLAGAALRSTKSQAIIVMTTAQTETPVE